MEDCNDCCHDCEQVMCRHRFNFDAHIVYTNGYIGFVQFFDFQIVLHFLYLIEHGKVPCGKSCKYIIVTCDKSFLRSARKEWEKKSKSNTRPKLKFGERFVRSGNITIQVEVLNTHPYGDDKVTFHQQLVQRLNKQYGQQVS